MKFNFWLELPMAIMSLLDTYNSLEDLELGNSLLNSCKAMEHIFAKIDKEVDLISSSCYLNENKAKEVISGLKKRLIIVEKEKTEIILQSMKFSVKLTSKFISIIEKSLLESNSPENILIGKIKYFLNLIKSAITQINSHINKSRNPNSLSVSLNTEEEEKFCFTLKHFFEKSEAKLFKYSLNLITNNDDSFFGKNNEVINSLPVNTNHLVSKTPNPNRISNQLIQNKQFSQNLNDLLYSQHIGESSQQELTKKRANSFLNSKLPSYTYSANSTPQINMLKIDDQLI